MEHRIKLLMILGIPSLSALIFLIFCVCCCRRRKGVGGSRDVEIAFEPKEGEEFVNPGDLIKFEGGENLSVQEILEAPGEVIWKSSYGTLYRARLVGSNSLTLLRFLRPTCALSVNEMMPVVEFLGSVRHPHLVPLNAFYAGNKGEKLMAHPFYGFGNLAHFLRDSNGEVHKWPIIRRISTGIARAVFHLHTSFDKPIIHGNLKSKNILLDSHYNPYVSDFGLHLLLMPTAAQQMLEALECQGYKAPELIKMKEACEDSDVYSFGVILLELLTGKEPVDANPKPGHDFYLPNAVRRAVLHDQIAGLYHPGVLLGLSNDHKAIVHDCILKYFQLAMACCSPSRLLRPDMRQILDRLEEIGK